MSTSQANHPTEQIVPQQKHQLPLKRQPPFFFIKPPFGDCHQFSSPALDLRLKELEVIVVKSSPLKRKSEKADLVAKSSEWNPSTGYVEAVGSPLQTPVLGKRGNTQKAPRMAKSNRSGSQTPVSNVGLVTKKFINLIKNAEDSILDLNKAADTLEVYRHRTVARSVGLNSLFVKPTFVPHFEVLELFKLRLLGVFQFSPSLFTSCID